MLKAVIAMSSDDLCNILKEHLERNFTISCCHDGQTALTLLKDLRPEILIIDLSIPLLDGISLLEQAKEFRPPVILATVDCDSHYVRNAAEDIGIGYIMKLPCDINALITRLLDMVNRLNKTQRRQEAARTQTVEMLLELDFATNLDGYLYLQAAIPLFADNPSQRMGKELYSNIASLLGVCATNNIERSIRAAIEDAWRRRSNGAWDRYFPEGSITKDKGPSNKLFISRMAEEMNQR